MNNRLRFCCFILLFSIAVLKSGMVYGQSAEPSGLSGYCLAKEDILVGDLLKTVIVYKIEYQGEFQDYHKTEGSNPSSYVETAKIVSGQVSLFDGVTGTFISRGENLEGQFQNIKFPAHGSNTDFNIGDFTVGGNLYYHSGIQISIGGTQFRGSCF